MKDRTKFEGVEYPNVQVRLFNPFPGGRGSDLTRFISSGLEFGRINRRMHNKFLVTDNAAAVAVPDR